MQPRYLSVWLLLLVLPFGCAGKKAQNLARATLEQVKVYEQEVGKRVTAENKFYEDRISSLQKRLRDVKKDAEEKIVTSSGLAFQREVFNSKKDLQAKDLKDDVFNVLEEIRQSREGYTKARILYKEDLLKSLAKLEFQKQSLGKVQQGLGQLQSKSNNLKMLKEWFEFAYKMKKEFEKSLPAEASE